MLFDFLRQCLAVTGPPVMLYPALSGKVLRDLCQAGGG